MFVIVDGTYSQTEGENNLLINSSPPFPSFLLLRFLQYQTDLGIDQLALFGYGGTPPRDHDGSIGQRQAATPALDGLADAGVRFRNFWATPD